jgi:hypothetical protein
MKQAEFLPISVNLTASALSEARLGGRHPVAHGEQPWDADGIRPASAPAGAASFVHHPTQARNSSAATAASSQGGRSLVLKNA